MTPTLKYHTDNTPNRHTYNSHNVCLFAKRCHMREVKKNTNTHNPIWLEYSKNNNVDAVNKNIYAIPTFSHDSTYFMLDQQILT